MGCNSFGAEASCEVAGGGHAASHLCATAQLTHGTGGVRALSDNLKRNTTCVLWKPNLQFIYFYFFFKLPPSVFPVPLHPLLQPHYLPLHLFRPQSNKNRGRLVGNQITGQGILKVRKEYQETAFSSLNH